MSILLSLLVLVICNSSTTLADTVQLAECPQVPDVIGMYVNNGKKCVRERDEVRRDVLDATCQDGWELTKTATQGQAQAQAQAQGQGQGQGQEQGQRRKSYCKPVNSSNIRTRKKDGKPICPTDYQRYSASCHSPCPPGYNAKRGICIQLRDVLPQHSMICPIEGQHKVGPFCCQPDQCTHLVQQRQEQYQQSRIGGNANTNANANANANANPSWIECHMDEIPGKFYHNPNSQKCERTMTSLPRVWNKLPKDNRNRVVGDCSPDQVKVLGGCQAECPDGYKAKKGMCQLRPCSIPTDAEAIVLCPEGKYQIQAMSL
jgi:hypothetical protein